MRSYYKFTTENLNKEVEYRVDGLVVTRAVIKSTSARRGVLLLQLNLKEASELAKRLVSGKATFEVEPVSK